MLVRPSFQPSLQTRPQLSSLQGCTTTAEFNNKLYATDLYSGTIHNRTADKSAQFDVKIRNEDGKLAGCVGIVKPLYGSGPLEGLMKDGALTFSVKLSGFDLNFRAKNDNGMITGTYTVLPAIPSSASPQEGEVSLKKVDSKQLLLQPCPTDGEVNQRLTSSLSQDDISSGK